ncbi:hypothetical protein GEMRC1_001300 [Eukaryota sp. GEM-RC1]
MAEMGFLRLTTSVNSCAISLAHFRLFVEYLHLNSSDKRIDAIDRVVMQCPVGIYEERAEKVSSYCIALKSQELFGFELNEPECFHKLIGWFRSC